MPRLSLSRSTDIRDRNLHSLSHRFQFAVRPTKVNMCVCNVKSYTEFHEEKEGTKKAVTGLVSVPVSKTLV